MEVSYEIIALALYLELPQWVDVPRPTDQHSMTQYGQHNEIYLAQTCHAQIFVVYSIQIQLTSS